jgi:hypothetical protein
MAMTVQAKRFYYRSRCHPVSGKTDKLRNKVFLNGIQLFQLLVYRESDRRECVEEISSPAIVVEQLLLIRFVKQLVQLTLPRNAFYVTLALCHFLCDYSGSETLILYDSLFRHLHRSPDDSYRRARKSLLRTELIKRFGKHLILVHGPHGESHFLESPASAQFRELIINSLNELAPWGVPCLDLQPDAAWEENDHQSELRRMHILLHPPCLQLHCRRLGIASPLDRLRLPRFRETTPGELDLN